MAEATTTEKGHRTETGNDGNGATTAPPPISNEERVHRILRADRGVTREQVLQAILNLIEVQGTNDERIAIVATVLQDLPFIYWSGERTLANEYPEATDDEIADDRVEVFERYLTLAEAQIHADRAEGSSTETTEARVIWQLLSRLETNAERASALQHFLESPGGEFTYVAAPLALKFDGEIPRDEYRAILWENRRTLRRLLGSLPGQNFKTTTGFGETILTVFSEITDDRARAVVAGHFFNGLLTVRHRVSSLSGLLPLLLGGLGGRHSGIVEIVTAGPAPTDDTDDATDGKTGDN